jgi:hypothetical protein
LEGVTSHVNAIGVFSIAEPSLLLAGAVDYLRERRAGGFERSERR